MNWDSILNSIVSWATNTGIRIIVALIVMLISFKIIKWLCKKIEKAGDKKGADKTVMKTAKFPPYSAGIFLPFWRNKQPCFWLFSPSLGNPKKKCEGELGCFHYICGQLGFMWR